MNRGVYCCCTANPVDRNVDDYGANVISGDLVPFTETCPVATAVCQDGQVLSLHGQ